MSVAREKIPSCTSKSKLIWLFAYPPSAFSIARTPGSAAYRSLLSGTGAAVAVVLLTALQLAAEPAARDATEDRWTSRSTPTCWVCISAMDTSLAAHGTYSCSHSSAPTTGRGCSRTQGARCLTSCPYRASSASSDKDALRSRALPSTGRACSRSMGLDGNTLGKSSLSNGKPRSYTDTLANSLEGCSIPMAGVALTACAEGLQAVITGTSIRGICFPTSHATFYGCAARRWISSGWLGGSRGGMSFRWRDGRRWRGSTNSSGLSTDAVRMARMRGRGSGSR
jgi:hypothetical protein